MRKRTLIPLSIALAVIAALGVMLYLRAKAPPEAARLLPESDAIVYVQLKTLRSATHILDESKDSARAPGLQQFINATGIVPERDIDSAAFALHRIPAIGPDGKPHGLSDAELFTSEVFVGRFDGQRLNQYLRGIATAQEQYAGRTVYTVPMDGETVRIAQLGYDTIAASNMPTVEQIHSMLDRSRASALATPGSSLLAARFHDVPLLSEVWGIGHIGLLFAENGQISVMGMSLPISENADLVASLRYNATVHVLSGGAVQLRVEEIAPSPSAAATTIDSLTVLLGMLRGITGAMPPRNPSDSALREVIASATLTQHNDRALLDASATIEQLKAIFKNGLPTDADAAQPPPPPSKP